MKKISIVLLCALLAVNSAFASNIEQPGPKTGYENILVIKGNTETPEEKKLTVTVFQAGKSYENITQWGEKTDIIAFTQVIKSNENGEFVVEWTPKVSGYYDIFVSDGLGDVSTLENVYIPANARDIFDTVRKGSKEEINMLFGNEEKLLVIIRSKEVIESLKKPGNVAQAVYNIRESLKSDFELNDLINAAISVAELSENKNADSMEKTFELLEKLGLKISEKETINELATEKILYDMALGMNEIYKMKFDEFNEFVSERFVLSGIYKTENWMDAKEYLKIIEYPKDDSKYATAAKKITGNKYETITDLKKAIDKALQPSKSSSGGGGGSGGKSIGFTAPEKDSVINVGDIDTQPNISSAFPDVDKNHYAFDDINYLRWHDVISGDDNGMFRPSSSITRAETVKMLCRVFKIENVSENSFSDVSSGDWHYGFIGGAYKAGLIIGSDGQFKPNKFITREDLAVLVYRFAKYAGTEFAEAELSFEDKDEISEYAREAVGILNKAGIVNGVSNQSFAPKAKADRAQVAAMLARCMRSAERTVAK